ncbi:MAG: DUF1428 domain-containing protein [Candidatus Hydrogenedentes bacterium]|nr:DUF1428 domain-containing protein [Candidatus Hydrogenedentota bacterium]
MKYVDGYVIPVPKKNIKAYQKMASMAGKIWIEHGALDYKECVAEDMSAKHCPPFTKLLKTKPSETVVFSYIVFKSRAHRNKVNMKVMKDPRLAVWATKKMPFDLKKMSYGGFTTLVDMEKK